MNNDEGSPDELGFGKGKYIKKGLTAVGNMANKAKNSLEKTSNDVKRISLDGSPLLQIPGLSPDNIETSHSLKKSHSIGGFVNIGIGEGKDALDGMINMKGFMK